MRSGGFWLIFSGALSEKLFSVIAALVCNKIFAETYGPDGFGLLQAGLATVFIAGSFSLITSAQTMLPIIGRANYSRDSMLCAILSLRVFGSFVVWLVMMGVIYLFFGKIDAIVFYLSFSIFAEPLAIRMLYYYAVGKAYYVSLARIFGSIIRLSIVFGCCFFGFSIYVAAVAWPFELIAAGVFSFFVADTGFKISKIRKYNKIIPIVLYRGLKGFIPVIMYTLSSKIDRLLVNFYIKGDEFGVYSAAAALVEQYYMLIVTLLASFAGKYIYKEGGKKLTDGYVIMRALKLGGLALVGSCVIAIVFMFFGEEVINLIYGAKFHNAIYIVRFGLVSCVFMSIDAALVYFLYYKQLNGLLIFRYSLYIFLLILMLAASKNQYVPYVTYLSNIISIVIFWAFVFIFYVKKENV